MATPRESLAGWILRHSLAVRVAWRAGHLSFADALRMLTSLGWSPANAVGLVERW